MATTALCVRYRTEKFLCRVDDQFSGAVVWNRNITTAAVHEMQNSNILSDCCHGSQFSINHKEIKHELGSY